MPPIALVVSQYNATVTDRLLSGAVRAYVQAGGRITDLYVAQAPGAFEVLAVAAAAARSGAFAGVVAIGCIIKGETSHDEFLGHAVTSGLATLAVETGIPVGLAVLTVNTAAQAVARSGLAGQNKRVAGKPAFGNKGTEAMEAVLQTIVECGRLADGASLRRAMGDGQALARMAGLSAAVGARPDKAASADKPQRGKAQRRKGR